MQRVAWWFHRVRGLEFVSTAAIERIYTRTGGLPLLLDIVDSQLSPAAGTTVADDRVALSLAAIDEAIPRIARDLCDGSPAIRLENREREILQMIECIVSLEASAGLDLASSLTEVWELFADRCSIAPLGSEDSLCLEVLLESGLLPTKPSASLEDPLTRIGVVMPKDPVFEIVRAFQHR